MDCVRRLSSSTMVDKILSLLENEQSTQVSACVLLEDWQAICPRARGLRARVANMLKTVDGFQSQRQSVRQRIVGTNPQFTAAHIVLTLTEDYTLFLCHSVHLGEAVI